MAIAFSVAVIGAAALVGLRSCTNQFSASQSGEGNQALPTDQNIDKHRLEKLKKLLQQKGGMQELLQREDTN